MTFLDRSSAYRQSGPERKRIGSDFLICLRFTR